MDQFLLFTLVGFLAQLVDGALGMAYGVVCSTVLISSGVDPATASASVHATKLFTTAASALSHVAAKNVTRVLTLQLTVAGAIGGIAGTFLITGVDGKMIQPYIMGYLALMGVYILIRSIQQIPRKAVHGLVVLPVGGVGGFVDAIGGGGWGPVTTSSLLGAGGEARKVIGSVNTAEFFVAVAIMGAFAVAALIGHWQNPGSISDQMTAIIGLIVGGVMAAPLAAIFVRILPRRPVDGVRRPSHHRPLHAPAAAAPPLAQSRSADGRCRLWGAFAGRGRTGHDGPRSASTRRRRTRGLFVGVRTNARPGASASDAARCALQAKSARHDGAAGED